MLLRHHEKLLAKEEGKVWMLFSRLGMRVGVSISGQDISLLHRVAA